MNDASTRLLGFTIAALLTACADGGGDGSSGPIATIGNGSADAGSEGTSASDSGTMTGDTGNGGDDGEPAAVCEQACTEPADCCIAESPECPGSYPYNWTCENGWCVAGACETDQQCVDSTAGVADACVVVDGVRSCVQACPQGTECSAPFVCLDEGYCADPPDACTSDDACSDIANVGCDLETGTCTKCLNDEGCFGNGICVDGTCGCTNSDHCIEGFECRL